MKRKILGILILCIIGGVAVSAADLTPEQNKFRSNIVQFLKEEGFSPSIDEDDNSVVFKKEGEMHWISIADSNPFYIEFYRTGIKCNDANRDLVIAAVNEGNKKVRCAKAILNESSITLVIEMYCHAAEEFRYVFYKNMKELESLENTILDYYNGNNQSAGSTASASTGSAAINNFFPVYGFVLGQVTSSDFKAKGYTVETIASGARNCDVKNLTFWDHNQDDVFEHIYITNSDYMPDKWEELGLNWRLSYNQLLNLFRGMGFTIRVEEEPTTKSFSNRKTLSADVVATSVDGHLVFDFDFDYGNDNGEGYSLDSPNSLYSITIKIK